MKIDINHSRSGHKISLSSDIFAKGFSDKEAALLLDGIYNETGGFVEEKVDIRHFDQFIDADEEIYDALITTYSKLPRVMGFIQKNFNRTAQKENISFNPPVMGGVKKSGIYASVTVEFPVSDGQSVYSIFHAPDGNPKQIDAQDRVIAFRWMLNGADITPAVTPTRDSTGFLVDISLDELSKRIVGLAAKNSDKFVKRQQKIKGDKLELEQLNNDIEKENQRIKEIGAEIDSIKNKTDSSVIESRKISKKTSDLKKKNEQLEAKLKELQEKSKQKELVKFEVGQNLQAGHIGDMSLKIKATVLRRTAKTLWLRMDNGMEIQRKIHIDDNMREFVYPDGRYAKAPIFRAGRDIVTEAEQETELEEKKAPPDKKAIEEEPEAKEADETIIPPEETKAVLGNYDNRIKALLEINNAKKLRDKFSSLLEEMKINNAFEQYGDDPNIAAVSNKITDLLKKQFAGLTS